jgi:hypothetical protein
MFEKYDAYVIGEFNFFINIFVCVEHSTYVCMLNVGSSGEGGQYTPQVGFGWTNGVALTLLARNYGINVTDDDYLSDDDYFDDSLSVGEKVGIAIAVIGLALILGTVAYYHGHKKRLARESTYPQAQVQPVNIQTVTAHAQVVAPLHAQLLDNTNNKL